MRHLVPTSYGQLHVRDHGAGGVPLVLLHMSPRSSRMFERLQPLVRRRSIAPDRLGYGCSDAPSRVLTLEEYTHSTIEALEALGVRGPVDVLGMHTGSLEAIELAHQWPGRVRRVVVVAVPLFTAEEKAHGLATFARLRIEPREDGSHLTDAWRARFQYRHPPYDLEDIQARFVDYVLAARPGEAYDAVFRYDAASRLASLPVPLVVIAPHDDLAATTARSRSSLPAGATWVDLPELGIDLFTVAAPAMAELIETYL
jgi:pimeloyl-ACP methyl ester carboxylesterase